MKKGNGENGKRRDRRRLRARYIQKRKKRRVSKRTRMKRSVQ